MVRVIWATRPERIVLKEMLDYLRGRQPGEVLALISDEFAALGAPADRIVRVDSELEATRDALAWAEDGDLLLLAVQSQREAVIDLLRRLKRDGWLPGRSLDSERES